MAMPKQSRPGDLPGELHHPLHQGHTLKLVPGDDGVGYRCDGCKLAGTGARYECGGGGAARCDFDLHPGCALAPAERHIAGFPFALLPRSAPGGGRRVCDACGGGARGLVYHCAELGHDVHPCCADDLPGRFALAGLSLELRMEGPRPPRRCVLCAGKKQKQGRAVWSYRCDVGDGGGAVLLHVACARALASETVDRVSLDEAYHKVVASDAYRGVVHSPELSSPAGRG